MIFLLILLEPFGNKEFDLTAVLSCFSYLQASSLINIIKEYNFHVELTLMMCVLMLYVVEGVVVTSGFSWQNNCLHNFNSRIQGLNFIYYPRCFVTSYFALGL